MSGYLEGLSARGFAPRMSVRVSDCGARKINVIKVVRELTGFGLKRTKDAVEQGHVLFDALEPARARDVATQIEEQGATVSVELARTRRHAYRASDPQRGGQVCERMVAMLDQVVLERGRIGAMQPVQTLQHSADAGELLAAIDAQCGRWAAAGWFEAGDEIELLQRLSARDEALEAEIRAADGDAFQRAAAVYADWLQGQGDARGLVAALALALDEAGDEPQRERQAAALDAALDEHAAHLFGPAQALRKHVWLHFAGPFLDSMELPIEALSETIDCGGWLELLLELPISAALRHLTLRGRLTESSQLGAVLGRAACADSLRTLVIRDAGHWLAHGSRFERLEVLDVQSWMLVLTGLVAPSLQRLRVELRYPGYDIAAAFEGLDAPRLQTFELVTQTYDDWDQRYGPLLHHLRGILEQPSLSQLRCLKLDSRPGSQPHPPDLCDMLLATPARATLEAIDLRECLLTPEALARLRAHQDQLPGLLLPA